MCHSCTYDLLMLENLGPRIREIRKEKGLTLIEIAEKTGIAQATLSRIETGTMLGTVESHAKIAEILGVGLADLYTDIDTRRDQTFHQPKTSRLQVAHHDKTFQLELLTSESGKRKMSPFLLTLQPGGRTGTECYDRETEKFIFVLEGEASASVDGKEYPLKQGETLYFEASLPHFFRGTGGKVSKLLVTLSRPAV